MADVTYKTDLSIYQMVLDRLQFLEDTAGNQNRVGRIIYELMYELERCFKVSVLSDENNTIVVDETRIGVEGYYSVLQRSVLADLAAVYTLVWQGATSASSSGETSSTPAGTYIKRAKAGSAEVEYDQLDIKKGFVTGTSGINGLKLIEFYKNSAVNRALKIGCYLDFTDDFTVQLAEASMLPTPFIIAGGCGCR